MTDESGDPTTILPTTTTCPSGDDSPGMPAISACPAPTSPAIEPDPTGEIAAATADLDEDVPVGTSIIVPNAPPLTLGMVESVLDRRRSEVQISPTLARITALLDVLGNPQDSFPIIQIAGTNGKTSTARMIDSLLERLGLRVGRFTSPHLQQVTERIAVDGAPITADQYVEFYTDIAPYIDLVDAASDLEEDGLPLSKFEILTAMAYAAFADIPVDAGGHRGRARRHLGLHQCRGRPGSPSSPRSASTTPSTWATP